MKDVQRLWIGKDGFVAIEVKLVLAATPKALLQFFLQPAVYVYTYNIILKSVQPAFSDRCGFTGSSRRLTVVAE